MGSSIGLLLFRWGEQRVIVLILLLGGLEGGALSSKVGEFLIKDLFGLGKRAVEGSLFQQIVVVVSSGSLLLVGVEGSGVSVVFFLPGRAYSCVPMRGGQGAITSGRGRLLKGNNLFNTLTRKGDCQPQCGGDQQFFPILRRRDHLLWEGGNQFVGSLPMEGYHCQCPGNDQFGRSPGGRGVGIQAEMVTSSFAPPPPMTLEGSC